MDHFNVRGGLYGDTTDRLQELTRLENAARYGAACLIEDGTEHRIGGTFFGASKQTLASSPSQGLRV